MNNEHTNYMRTGFGKTRAASIPNEILANQGRVPPQAIDLEEVVLGAMMLEKGAVNAVIDMLTPEVFYKEAHQLIFTAIKDLFGIFSINKALSIAKDFAEILPYSSNPASNLF